MISKNAIGLMGIGFLIGALSSLLGIGGGLLLVPAIVILYHFKIQDAMAISLAAMFPIVLASGFLQLLLYEQVIPYFPIVVLTVTGIIGSYIGVLASHALKHDTVVMYFSILLVILAVYVSGIFNTTSLIQLTPSLIPLMVVGIVGGFISGLFGISGGVFLVPILNQTFGYSIQHAALISLLMLGPLLLAGAFFHHKKASLNKHILLLIIPSAFSGILLGSYLSFQLTAIVIQQIFAGILLIMATQLFLHERHEHKHKEFLVS